MTRILALAMLFSCALSAPARSQSEAACTQKAVRFCDEGYRRCLSDCAYVDGFQSDECRYLCCEDRRACYIVNDCQAAGCR